MLTISYMFQYTNQDENFLFRLTRLWRTRCPLRRLQSPLLI